MSRYSIRAPMNSYLLISHKAVRSRRALIKSSRRFGNELGSRSFHGARRLGIAERISLSIIPSELGHHALSQSNRHERATVYGVTVLGLVDCRNSGVAVTRPCADVLPGCTRQRFRPRCAQGRTQSRLRNVGACLIQRKPCGGLLTSQCIARAHRRDIARRTKIGAGPKTAKPIPVCLRSTQRLDYPRHSCLSHRRMISSSEDRGPLINNTTSRGRV